MKDRDGPKVGRPAYDDDEVTARREVILEAAIALVPRLGPSDVRLKDIAAEAGVSVGTLQHYFDNRDELLQEAFAFNARRIVDGIHATMNPHDSPWQQICCLVARFTQVDELRQRSALWIEFAASSARNDELRRLMGETYAEWRLLLAAAISSGIKAGTFDPPTTERQVVDGICALLDGYELANAIGVWRESNDESRESLLHLIASMLGHTSLPTAETHP